MNRDRMSGVLLHVTSLPSPGGVGDFGPAAYAFVDFLAAAKQRLWQVLPLNPPGFASSPYSAVSAFAGNPALISLERLAEEGWIAAERVEEWARLDEPADLVAAARRKRPLIEDAAGNFLDRANDGVQARFQSFCQENMSWLPDYASYVVLRRRFGDVSWNEWPEEFALRKHDTLSALLTEHGRELAVEQVIQFFFDEQWRALRVYCTERKIRILGDLAIFVNYDSADVWTHPELFELDEKGRMVRVSGVPPDYYSATGQRWGNPLYRWGLLQERGFDWWVARVRRSLALYDVIRLDHFRGFEAYWSIAADEPTAIHGQWVKAPGLELFQRLQDVFGELPFIAEDLGLITPEVDELRERYGMPGMRVLQFGFSDRGAHIYLPHQYVPNTVAYTGTHDNDTMLGWWKSGATEVEREHVQRYLQPIAQDGEIVSAMMRAAARSVAKLCIFTMQDILCLGSEARMNTPANRLGNWSWRYAAGAIKPEMAEHLAELMELTDRDEVEAAKADVVAQTTAGPSTA
jgi:4-alpha-glucanotransferase